MDGSRRFRGRVATAKGHGSVGFVPARRLKPGGSILHDLLGPRGRSPSRYGRKKRGGIKKGSVPTAAPNKAKSSLVAGIGSYYNSNNEREASMVELKVRRFGNSLGVVLPKDVVNRLHTKDGEPLFLIEAPDGGYRLTPYDPVFEKKMAKAEEIVGRYRNTLQALSK